MKRRIVAETLEPGSSVSIVAGCHDVNANQLFKWRREMAPEQPAGAEQGVTMLRVAIVPELSAPRVRARPSGTIEITFASGARVCVRGNVSPGTLRWVIERCDDRLGPRHAGVAGGRRPSPSAYA